MWWRQLAVLVLALALVSPALDAHAEGRRVELHRLSETIWVHTAWKVDRGVRTPSNGLLVVTTEGLVLVDTPWNDEQTRDLLDTAEKQFGIPPRLAIITHAHEDRLGGVETLLARNIAALYTEHTALLAERQGYRLPEPRLDPCFTDLEVGGVAMEVYFPGEGHTADNMTVWFPAEQVLFAGCLVKAASSTSVGNVEDANVRDWPNALDRLLDRYPGAQTVVPGHGEWGGISLLNHTLDLLSRFGA